MAAGSLSYSRSKWAIAAVSAVAVALLLLYLLTPRAGQVTLDVEAGPAARAAQAKAIEVWRMDASDVDAPLRQLGKRDAVIRMARDPGHCDMKVPGEFSDPASYDYRGRVATLGPNDIVLASARFTCGGLQFSAD